MPRRPVPQRAPSAISERLQSRLEWVPLAAAAVYLAVLAFEFGPLIRALYWNSDIAFLPVVAESFASTPHPFRMVVGPNNSSTTLWFDLITHRLPFHRLIWQAAPYIWALSGLLLLVWCAWRIAGRWAAMLTFALGVSSTPIVLESLVSQSVHVTTWLADDILVAFLVVVSARKRISQSTVVAACAVAVIIGTNLASDPLLLASGVAPFVLAPFFLCLITRRRQDRALASIAIATALLGLLVAAITLTAMHHAGVSITTMFLGTTGRPGLVTPAGIGRNTRALFSDVLAIGNGQSPGRAFGRDVITRWTGAVLSLGAIGVALGEGFLQFRPTSLRARASQTTEAVYLTFWALTVVTVGLGFVMTNAPVGEQTGRYLIPLYYAAVGALPIMAVRSEVRRSVAAVAAAIFCAISTGAIAQPSVVRATNQMAIVQQSTAIRTWLIAERLKRGYAGYWTANALTWNSGAKVRVSPVWECGASPSRLCAFPANRLTGWYVPQVGTPTFLIVDSAGPSPRVTGPPQDQLGPSSSTHQFGPITIYIYPYDIATRLPKPK